MGSVFFELTIIICVAAVLSVIFRILRQPPILAYILTGILIGPFGQLQLQSKDLLQVMGEFGITLLLFMVGLELKFSDLRSVGKAVLATGIAQVILTFLSGYLLSVVLGFSPIVSLYLGAAFTFSSTIMVVKLLSDKRDLVSLYGKLSVGVLLVQDFFAIFALIILSGFTKGNNQIVLADFIGVVVKALLLFGFVVVVSKTVLPRILRFVAGSSETLFLFSIAFALFMSVFAASSLIGFSPEIGGFLAGLALANTSENFQILARVKSLRDFFITIFFVIVGMGMTFGNIGIFGISIVVFAAFVLIGKPLILTSILGLLGHRKRTSFLTGLTIAQVSEFSLVIIFLGNRLSHISNDVVSLVGMVAIISFAFSSYAILGSNTFYKKLSGFLGIFEQKGAADEALSPGLLDLKNHVVLVGVNRMGDGIRNALKDEGETVLVVDFNPDTIQELKNQGVLHVFGDIADPEIQERAGIFRAKLIISTVADIEDNIIFIETLRKAKSKTKVVIVGQSKDEAEELYKKGADYVVLPHELGGKHLAKIIRDDNLKHLENLVHHSK